MRGRLWVFALLVLGGCGTATRVRPLPKGTLAVEAAVGGPAVAAGAPIPLPLGSLGVRYGVAERLDLSTHAHLTPLAVFLLPGIDLAATALVVDQRGASPALAVGAKLYAFSDLRSGVLGFAETSATVSWLARERYLTYFDLTGQLDLVQRTIAVAPAIGEELRLESWALQLELRWYDPFYDTRNSAVPWLSPFKQGAVGLMLGARREL